MVLNVNENSRSITVFYEIKLRHIIYCVKLVLESKFRKLVIRDVIVFDEATVHYKFEF